MPSGPKVPGPPRPLPIETSFSEAAKEHFRTMAWSDGVPGGDEDVEVIFPTVLHGLADSARRDPTRGITLIPEEPDDPEQHRTYADLLEDIRGLARHLASEGLARGDRVLLVLPTAALAQDEAIELTEAQKQWLAMHPSIRLAVDIDWSPFEYIDDEYRYVGMAAEYIDLVGQKLGIEFDVEKDKPWSEVVDSVKKRELDMFSCVVATVQRREYADFTKPYLSFPMVIVTSDQVAYVNGIRDLKNETVAVVRGYATQDLLEKDHPDLDLYLADNVGDALEKLSHGQVYAYIGNIATVSDVIRREGLTNIKISGETPYRYELSMAVRNDWSEFVPILQKALDSITEQERDQIYRNWIKLRYEHGFDYQLMWKILAVVFCLVAIVLFWNRRLSAEISRRIQAEKQVQQAHYELEQANQQLVIKQE